MVFTSSVSLAKNMMVENILELYIHKSECSKNPGDNLAGCSITSNCSAVAVQDSRIR